MPLSLSQTSAETFSTATTSEQEMSKCVENVQDEICDDCTISQYRTFEPYTLLWTFVSLFD